MQTITTERLVIRDIADSDTAFLLELINSDAFINNIGDRQIRTETDMLDKIKTSYRAQYPNHGLFIVAKKANGESIGTVSYLKRPSFDADDIGYAFIEQHWGQGYALEATSALLDYHLARGVTEVWGVVDFDNQPSLKLLKKLDFVEQGTVVMEGEQTPICKLVFQQKQG